MRDFLPAFGRHLADRRSPRTQKTYGAILASFVALVEQRGGGCVPGRADVEAFLARNRLDGERRSPAARNQELAALRAFARFAARELGWTTNLTEGIEFAREAPRDPAVLSVFEVRRLFVAAAACSPPGQRAQNLALLAVLAQTGLRAHELVGLDLSQVDVASATLVAVRGKGGTVHDVPLNAATLGLVVAWLGARWQLAAASVPALFLSSRGNRLSVRAVERLMVRLREAMGTKKKLTPHTLRHSAATQLLTLGVDVSTVGDVLRHADLNVTRRYLHLVDERRRDAVGRLAVAIPPELHVEPAGAIDLVPLGLECAARPENDNVRPFSWAPLDDQHGLDDAA